MCLAFPPSSSAVLTCVRFFAFFELAAFGVGVGGMIAADVLFLS
jgi:hypothetical protein